MFRRGIDSFLEKLLVKYYETLFSKDFSQGFFCIQFCYQYILYDDSLLSTKSITHQISKKRLLRTIQPID